jgi:4-amino-4-deoxy-L-arabinose transferase-like glycosyltransferase
MRMFLELVSFATILALGFVLRLYALTRNGFGNEYYSAGVLSMTRSLHNFFFNAFDPAGILALDKPPLALWVQVASARLFGFAPLSLLVPQAIEGMISVAVVWHLVRRRFGAKPALLAAFLMATTPISVAVDRSSNTDSCLVMVLVLAAWALLTAAERGSWRLLLLAMALVGAGFNVKMLAAFIVLPAFAFTYWLGSPHRPGNHSVRSPESVSRATTALGRVHGILQAQRRRLSHLAAGGIVCAAVSLAWVGAVELTPPSDRPFVDSSPTNSMLDLVVDHNGLQRFVPRTNPPLAGPRSLPDQRVPAGPLRLADPRLATQVGWLVPLALIGGLSALAGLPLAAPAALSLFLWLGWLLTYAVVYSAAGGLFSAYYLVTLTPPLAVLASVGFLSLWARWRDSRRGWWMLPLTLVLTAGWQVWLIVPITEIGGTIDAVTTAETGRRWLALGVMGSVMAAVLGLVLAPHPRDARRVTAFGLLALLAAPALWAGETAFAHIQGPRPMAALDDVTQASRWHRDPQADAALADFLRANAGATRFLAATIGARQAAPLILATGAPVLAMGGFIGNLPVVTLPTLQALVGSGQLRFVLLDDPERTPGNAGAHRFAARWSPVQQDIAAWVRDHGAPVDPTRWHPQGETISDGARPMVARLYDLGGGAE